MLIIHCIQLPESAKTYSEEDQRTPTHTTTTLDDQSNPTTEMSHFTEEKHNLGRFDTVLDTAQVDSFNEKGYVIIDNFLGDEWGSSLLDECKRLQADGDLKQHYFNFGEVKFEKPHVFEADLFDKTLRDKSAPLAHLYDMATPRVVSALDSLLPDLKLDTGSTSASVSIKLQYSHG